MVPEAYLGIVAAIIFLAIVVYWLKSGETILSAVMLTVSCVVALILTVFSVIVIAPLAVGVLVGFVLTLIIYVGRALIG